MREALGNECFEGLHQQRADEESADEALQEELDGDRELQCVEVPPLRKVAQCFKGVEELALRTGVTNASEALRHAKRALFEA